MLSTILLIIFSILTTVTAQLFIKRGALNMGNFGFSFQGFINLILTLLQNIWLMTGLFFFGLSFLLWIVLLSKLQLNIIYPVVVSLNFCLITIFSWIIFREYLSWVQILGIAIIIAGTFLVMSRGLV